MHALPITSIFPAMVDDELKDLSFKAMQAELQAREKTYQHDILLGPEASTVLDFARREDARHLPLKRLPCANVSAEKGENCNQSGTMVCTKCRLVSYCSKVSTLDAIRSR